MQLAKCKLQDGTIAAGTIHDDFIWILSRYNATGPTLFDLLERPNRLDFIRELEGRTIEVHPLASVDLLPPIDEHEVWAAGVTYKRSKSARMEESEAAASCYDRVYESPRPELFLKATPHRVVGTGGALRIRADATWNVPEPEFTLVLNSRLEICGATIGNDMSSRDIEGDNPLYLPQAKVYDQCCGIGPWVTLYDELPNRSDIGIRITITRDNQIVFEGSTTTGEMARQFDELVDWLGRDNSFPNGALLMTGTGIVPDSDFTLLDQDSVAIEIDGIGRLVNSVEQRAAKKGTGVF